MSVTATAVVDFPLRGEWWALATPAERVPSHGTDYFGQRYAFDFARMDPTGTWYAEGGGSDALRHATVGLAASRFLAWGQPVHAVADGRVLAAGDGWEDHARVRLVPSLLRATIVPVEATPADIRPLAGNFVLVEGADAVALYAHLRRGSVRVAAGARVRAGDLLGEVGNSGNSTMPHLHFHLMDGADPFTARGVACAFRRYEEWSVGAWRAVSDGVPPARTRIRAH